MATNISIPVDTAAFVAAFLTVFLQAVSSRVLKYKVEAMEYLIMYQNPTNPPATHAKAPINPRVMTQKSLSVGISKPPALAISSLQNQERDRTCFIHLVNLTNEAFHDEHGNPLGGHLDIEPGSSPRKGAIRYRGRWGFAFRGDRATIP